MRLAWVNMVIAHSGGRKRLSRGNTIRDREIRKKLRRLHERGRKVDVLRKTDAFIENLAIENNASVAVSDINRDAKKRMEENKDDKLRHRIHQWSVSTLIKLLEEKPIHVAKISERGSSSKDPTSGSRIGRYSP